MFVQEVHYEIIAKTDQIIIMKSEMDTLIEECQNNSEQWPALHWAIAKLRRPDVALQILQLHPEEVGKITPKTVECVELYDYWGLNFVPEPLTTEGASALWLAAREGYADVVHALINNGADLNFMRRFRMVDEANRRGRRGIDDPPSEYGTTALSEAIQHQHKEVIQLLLGRGASTNSIFYETQYTRRSGWAYSTSYYNMKEYLLKLEA